jgi:hypothetical protein
MSVAAGSHPFRFLMNTTDMSHFDYFLLHGSDCNNPLFLCKGAGDCLCIRHSCCVAVNSPSKGCGMTTDKDRNECIKIGCFCCDLGLVWPRVLCGCASQVCCCYDVAAFPCDDEFIPGPVCTICCPFLQVCPKCGCCVAPPPCPALDKVLRDQPLLTERMDRGAILTSTTTKTIKPDGTTEVIAKVFNPDGSTTVTHSVVTVQADDILLALPEAEVFIPPPPSTSQQHYPAPSAPLESMVKHC